MAVSRSDLLQGTLDLLVLRTLLEGEMHGWALAQRIFDRSANTFQVQQGSLYPALHRLEDHGWVRGSWGISEQGRRARFYTLTAAGRRQLLQERANWERYVEAVRAVLRPIDGAPAAG